MMSINEINNYTFQQQRGGYYKTSEVDEVFSQVKETLEALATAYEKAKRENDELYKKITALSDKVEEYKKDEESIHAALVTAQRWSDKMMKEAKEKSDALIGEAQEKADETIASIKGATDSYVKENREAADAYLEKAKVVYDEKLAEINGMADGIIDKAKKEAELVISDAEIKADEIIAKANLQSDEITSNADAKIETAQKKLADFMALTNEYKSNVLDILNKQIALFDSINVNDSDYLAEYYPQTFHISANDVYHPEFIADEYAEQLKQELSDNEAENNKADNTETVDDKFGKEADVEEQDEIVVSEETVEDNSADEPQFESTENNDEIFQVSETEISDTEDKIADDNSGTEEYGDDEQSNEFNEVLDEINTESENSDEVDYFEILLQNLAKEENELPNEPIEVKSNSIFTTYDLEEGIDDEDDEDRIDLHNLRNIEDDEDEDEDEQLEFGNGFDLFDDADDNQGKFFGRFKKK